MKHGLEVLGENDDFICINKPAGLLSIPDRTQSEPSLKGILQERYESIFTVHRLDKGTSGVILFAKNDTAHKFFSQQFEERTTQKIYVGLVLGKMPEESGVINEPIAEHFSHKGEMMVSAKGKPSITEYTVLENFGVFAFVQFNILTGRTHQIRVHMKHLGNPIACDDVYGDGKPVLLSSIKKKFKLSKHDEEERPILARLGLHAKKLVIKNLDGNDLTFEAEMPKDMRALLQQLRKVSK